MRDIDYFKTDPSDPPPLKIETAGRVRFEEVDALKMVWHGRYASYFEDGRRAFGEKYNLRYTDMIKNEFTAPIVKMHVDYFKPLRFDQKFIIQTFLHWSRSAKLNFSYRIHTKEGELSASGYTVQVFITLDDEPLMLRPDLVEDLYSRWEKSADE